MVVVSAKIGQSQEDIVVVAESDKPNRMDLVAYRGLTGSTPESKAFVTLKKPGNALHILESSDDGQVLVGALNDRLVIGNLSQRNISNFDEIQYDFFSFDAPDLVTAIDLRITEKHAQGNGHGSKKNRHAEVEKAVDILVGGARGSIYLYQDALARIQASGKSSPDSPAIQAQKYHWHRKAVHAVKWSRDGSLLRFSHIKF